MASILQNHYVLAVHDLIVNAQFLQLLGFNICAKQEGWIFLQKDNCMMMLGECKDSTPASQLGDHSYFCYLRVDDVDEYYAEIQKKGVPLSSVPINKPWEMREFAITLPEGHRLTIGQWIGEL